MAQEFNDFQFQFKANPLVLDFSELPMANFRRNYMESDVFSFYPYMEVFFEDELGAIPDRLLFVEGLEIQVKCGFEELGYIEHNYCWSEAQLTDCQVTDHLSGLTSFFLLSKHYHTDYRKSKAWKNKTLSSIAQEIATNDFGIPANKQFISTTDGINDFPQVNETNAQYLKRIADMAYSLNYPKSPFFTFINSQGEFYFMAIEEMFKSQQSVATFKIKMDENQTIDPDIIKRYDVVFGGLPVNKEDYRKKIYYIENTGMYSNETTDINNHFTKEPREKYLLRNQYLPLGQTCTDYWDMGIAETIEDKKIAKGKLNSMYKDSMTSIRKNTVIFFNHLCVAGKLITIEVDSAFDDKQVATEYSGKWLILKDQLLFGNTEIPYQNLLLCKSGIQVDSNHVFFNDFLT